MLKNALVPVWFLFAIISAGCQWNEETWARISFTDDHRCKMQVPGYPTVSNACNMNGLGYGQHVSFFTALVTRKFNLSVVEITGLQMTFHIHPDTQEFFAGACRFLVACDALPQLF
jgi:hypothetical protein